MEIEDLLRELAKTNYYQTMYSSAKDLGLKLFKEDYNLSDLQIRFINYLGFYSSIYTDIAMGDVDDVVMKDFIYEDAWSYYKRKKNIKTLHNTKNTEKPPDNSGTSWIFKRAKKV